VLNGSQERDVMSKFARRLREERQIRCPIVSIGSTPTCSLLPDDMGEVNEIHPGMLSSMTSIFCFIRRRVSDWLFHDRQLHFLWLDAAWVRHMLSRFCSSICSCKRYFKVSNISSLTNIQRCSCGALSSKKLFIGGLWCTCNVQWPGLYTLASWTTVISLPSFNLKRLF
jgi:hypothetical protein